MRLLVTGGAGFIGSNFVSYILEHSKHSVVTVDSLTYAGEKSNLDAVRDHPDHEFVKGDIRERDLISGLLEDCDGVVNFAAQTHVDRSIEGAGPFVQTNVAGAQTLFEAALDADIERFVQISTDEVYGEIEDGAFTEADEVAPRNPYAATKASADLLGMSFYETHDLPVMLVRPSNNFGPHQHPEKLIPKLIRRASAGKSLPLYGDGTNVREWTYVEDTCRAVETVLEQGTVGEIYNAGSGNEQRNIDVAESIVEAVGADQNLIEFVADRPGHDQRYALDSSKLQSLGWEAERTFESGLNATVDYYR
ncbi:dTDP-glucose 4,6-dehydratase [Haloarcula salina]|uniref:dTDP-glucose 4,6-dehydratase n=1 Tax=Haloarcula salina TaxID=1429914 RepID=UPI003C701F85